MAGAFDREHYDVVIAGASFAGLVVATQLRGRVLLLDRGAIGSGQTSACGTTVSALRAVEALQTVQQVHHDLVLHLEPAGAGGPEAGRDARRTLHFRLPYDFCTFDYGELCRLLGRRVQSRGVDFRQARAIRWQPEAGAGTPPGGDEGGVLETDQGPVRARCIVDATGWRATIARSIDPAYVRGEHLSCGLEAELPQPVASRIEGLHFWAGSGTVWPGYAWSFPAGRIARLGVIAYPDGGRTASKQLREALDTFLDGPGSAYWSPDGNEPWRSGAARPTDGRHLHGGFLPAAPRRPVVGPVFVVGDAAGQCFGLTGEGIRPALAFAVRCGRLLQTTIDGRQTPAEARAAYARAVRWRAPYWRLMRLLQRLVSRMNDRGLARYSLCASPRLVFAFLMGQYLWPADPAPLLLTNER
jgi:flavin-dependent dehydrogenase